MYRFYKQSSNVNPTNSDQLEFSRLQSSTSTQCADGQPAAWSVHFSTGCRRFYAQCGHSIRLRCRLVTLHVAMETTTVVISLSGVHDLLWLVELLNCEAVSRVSFFLRDYNVLIRSIATSFLLLSSAISGW